MLHEKVVAFISNFADAKDCFLHGCCYWFAMILQYRFSGQTHCELMYHVIDNHFATLIDGRLYDASGEISPDGFMPWSDMPDYDCLEYGRIITNCILLEP